ncbi:MAG: HAD family hydrolase [Oscillospiraceae bacterium]|nr:HAD family hydrolase [Oscillospiraceae bacterium]
MTKYPCLVLDHDDTVVQSEKTIGYPYFCHILSQFRPGKTISLHDYVAGCHNLGFASMCRAYWQFTEQELIDEYNGWTEYIRTHIPDPFPGIRDVILRQKAADGMICVVSHSAIENISRDYMTHFGVLPDAIYGWDLPEHQRKPSPYPLLDIMERYGFSAQELLVIDDLKLAHTMARAAGVEIGFAAWSKEEFPELSTEMTQLCDYTFHSTKELETFLFE